MDVADHTASARAGRPSAPCPWHRFFPSVPWPCTSTRRRLRV